MKIQKAFKFRLNTNKKDTRWLLQFAGACSFVWNKCLYISKKVLEQKQKIMYYNETSFRLTLWKKSAEYNFLKDCHSQVLQQSLKILEKAFTDCFDKKQPLKKFLRFKKKFQSTIFSFFQGFKIENNQVHLSKIGLFSFRKFSCIANSKAAFLHKISTNTSKSHAMIVIEDWRVRNLIKSAKGTEEKHGNNIKAKFGLHKSAQGQDWFEFRKRLEYKQLWSCSDLLAVNLRNTSRICFSCNYI